MTRKGWTAFALACAGGALMLSAGGTAAIDHAVLDAQWRYLRTHHHKLEARHVAIIGVDVRTLERIDVAAGEPRWRESYARLLQGMQSARAHVVGFMPDLPHSEARVVRGQDRGEEREFAFPGTVVRAALLRDGDAFVRRFVLTPGAHPTLVIVHGQILRTLLGERPVKRVSLAREGTGVLLAAALAWLRRWWLACLVAIALVGGAVAVSTAVLGQGRWWPVGRVALTACLSVALTFARSEQSVDSSVVAC